MSGLSKEKILKNSKEKFDELYLVAAKLSRTIELMDIDEESIKKEDVIVLDTAPTVDNTELKKVYSFADKLYVKVERNGGMTEDVLCYTDVFMQLVDTNNQLAKLSETLAELEDAEEEEENKED